MLVHTVHTTRYSYEGPVSHCLTEARLTPRTGAGQELLDWRLQVDPAPGPLSGRRDYFGNQVASFAVLEPHDHFTVTATSRVRVEARPFPVESGITCREAREVLRACESADLLEANQFLWESPFVPALGSLAEFGRDLLGAERALLAGALGLMRRIHAEFAYQPESTSIETPLGEVMESRKGVCQDFAHAMIGCLRAQGLAARYVSGYLRSDSELVGAQASHAWVSVYLPDAGWCDFDPTNNVVPTDGHVTLAWGRDYGDVPPVKGITIGGGKHTLEVVVRTTPA